MRRLQNIIRSEARPNNAEKEVYIGHDLDSRYPADHFGFAPSRFQQGSPVNINNSSIFIVIQRFTVAIPFPTVCVQNYHTSKMTTCHRPFLYVFDYMILSLIKFTFLFSSHHAQTELHPPLAVVRTIPMLNF